MSKAEELFKRIEKLSTKDLCFLCGNALNDERMDKQRIDILLLFLETRLQKRRIASSVGLTIDEDESK